MLSLFVGLRPPGCRAVVRIEPFASFGGGARIEMVLRLRVASKSSMASVLSMFSRIWRRLCGGAWMAKNMIGWIIVQSE